MKTAKNITLIISFCFFTGAVMAQERNYKEDMREVSQAEGMVADFITFDPLIQKNDSLWISKFEVNFDHDTEQEEFMRAVDRNERNFDEIRANVTGDGLLARVTIIMNENYGLDYLRDRLRELGFSHYTHAGDTKPISHLDINETVDGIPK